MRSLLLTCVALCLSVPAFADEKPIWPPQAGHSLTIGRMDSGAPLIAWMDDNPVNMQDTRGRILVVVDAGTHEDEFAALQKHAVKAITNRGEDKFCFAIVLVPPDAIPGVEQADRLLNFPPSKSAYNTTGERTAAAIWRFMAWFGPDFVIELHSQEIAEYQAVINGGSPEDQVWSKDCLAAAIKANSVAETGRTLACRIPSSVPLGKQQLDETLEPYVGIDVPRLIKTLADGSELRQTLQRRSLRKPEQVVDQLLAVYGNDLKTVMYQPALAVLARLETAQFRNDENQKKQVADILAPYLDGSKPALTDKANGSNFSGNLIFAAWAQDSGNAQAIELVRKVAEQGFDKAGEPLSAMPSHSEMSDAVFMACPILVAAADLTGDVRYLEMAQRHLRFMQKLCVRPDGLYRHSPLCEAAWGRGNGFPALGLALSLSDLDRMLQRKLDGPLRDKATELRVEMLKSLEQHLSALLPYQDLTGMWQQVIDEPVSYREMTSTCMIGFALTRGVSRGWLTDPKFSVAADRAWEAVKLRVGEKGELLDVCTGTGKQRTLEEYYDRTAILGRDERGGAMALIFAVEQMKAAKPVTEAATNGQ